MPSQAELRDVPVLNIASLLASSKRTSHRKECYAIAQSTANVFTDECLSTSDLRVRLLEVGEKFRITVGDLTPEGFDFVMNRWNRWLANTDRWTTERTVLKLENSLRKQVTAFRRTRTAQS